jgi:hypothetical protein
VQMVYFRLVLFLLCVVWKVFHGQPMQQPPPSAPHQPTSIRPRVRARRGQATDPHSIAERLRRERIAERIRALQELVPTVNKVCTFHPNPHLYIISLESLTLSVSPVFVCRPIELL